MHATKQSQEQEIDEALRIMRQRAKQVRAELMRLRKEAAALRAVSDERRRKARRRSQPSAARTRNPPSST
ncbi:MAG TPA: hypothetical protein VG269_16065 [Tepidisphaeraceae bacterium]|jgi:hypothetical protein|nr:hypothetical protein [Tepidisphaeraceae bacterium]